MILFKHLLILMEQLENHTIHIILKLF